MTERLEQPTFQAATQIARALNGLTEEQATLAVRRALDVFSESTPTNASPPPVDTTPPITPPARTEATTNTEERKNWLNRAVENKYINFTRNTALPFLLMVSPTARVFLEGANKVTNSFAEGKNGKAIKEIGYYTARTGLAYSSMGASEIAFGILKGISALREKDAQGNKKYAGKSIAALYAAAIGVSALTWYAAPMLSNSLIGGLQNTPAIQGLEKFGAATKLFQPELAKSYANVASRMALNTFVSWGGKKTFKRNPEVFEIARRTVTGAFALEAFGEGLYNSEGGILTGNRPIPFLGKTPFNLSQYVGDTVGKASADARTMLDDFLHSADKTYTPTEPLQPAIPLEPKGSFETPQLNQDGTIDQEDYSTSEVHDQSASVEVVSAHPISDEPISNIEEEPDYTHTHTTSGETTLISFTEDTPDDGHTTTEPLTHTSPTEFPIYKVDSNDATNLRNFVENPNAVTVPRQVITQPEALPGNDVYKIGEMNPGFINGLSIDKIDQLPQFILHHSQDIVDEAGKTLIEDRSPILGKTIAFHFSYHGTNVSVPINMHEAVGHSGNLSEYVIDKTEKALERSEFFAKGIYTDDADTANVYKVSILEQFADILQLEASSTHLLPTEHAKGSSDFGFLDEDITFYEELTARLYDENPHQAQYLFEDRIHPTNRTEKYLYQISDTVVAEGTDRIGFVTEGHGNQIPQSEFNIIYNLATAKEGFLNTSNNYFGHRGETAMVQLNDGTLLSFGAESGVAHEYTNNHFIHDDPKDPDKESILGELEAQIKAANPGISDEQLRIDVLEASVKLAEVAETHNFGKHLEDIIKANPGVPIQVKADGVEIIESFKIDYDPNSAYYHIRTSDGTYREFRINDEQLLIDFLSKEKLLGKYLNGLNFIGESDRYEEAIEALKDDIFANNPTLNIPTYFAVNGLPSSLSELDQLTINDPSEIIGKIVGDKIYMEQGYMAHLDPRLLDPEVPEIATSSHLYGKPDPDAMIDDIQRNIDTGNVKAYNPAQLVVLDEMGKYMIQSASREIAEAHFEDPKAFAEHPIVLHLPLSEAGYAKDYTIEVDGGPVDFEEMYTAIAKNINSNLREADIISGRYVDPSDHAFQVFVNQHIINTLFPHLDAKGIKMEDVIDQDKLYFAIGDDQRLEIPISELKEANPTYDVTREMIKLSLDHVVGRAENFDAEGNPVLTPLGFSPSAQILQTTTGSIPGAIGHGFSTIGGGFLDLAASYKDALFGWLGNIAGNPATQNTIRGTVDFTSAAVETGVPLAQYAANVAVGIPVETALETADVANSLKYSLNSVNIGGFRPFTLFDPMLERPLDTMGYLAGMNSGVYPYSVSGVINHVLSALNPEFPHLNGDYSLPDGIDQNTHVSSAIGHVAIAHDAQTYTVQSGDSLAKISRNIYGSEKYWPQLYEANRDVVEDPRKIFRGEVLRLPKINN